MEPDVEYAASKLVTPLEWVASATGYNCKVNAEKLRTEAEQGGFG